VAKRRAESILHCRVGRCSTWSKSPGGTLRCPAVFPMLLQVYNIISRVEGESESGLSCPSMVMPFTFPDFAVYISVFSCEL
jgi:hypothetical protein